MPGWTYDDVRNLPQDVHDVLVEAMNEPLKEDAG